MVAQALNSAGIPTWEVDDEDLKINSSIYMQVLGIEERFVRIRVSSSGKYLLGCAANLEPWRHLDGKEIPWDTGKFSDGCMDPLSHDDPSTLTRYADRW